MFIFQLIYYVIFHSFIYYSPTLLHHFRCLSRYVSQSTHVLAQISTHYAVIDFFTLASILREVSQRILVAVENLHWFYLLKGIGLAGCAHFAWFSLRILYLRMLIWLIIWYAYRWIDIAFLESYIVIVPHLTQWFAIFFMHGNIGVTLMLSFTV